MTSTHRRTYPVFENFISRGVRADSGFIGHLQAGRSSAIAAAGYRPQWCRRTAIHYAHVHVILAVKPALGALGRVRTGYARAIAIRPSPSRFQSESSVDRCP